MSSGPYENINSSAVIHAKPQVSTSVTEDNWREKANTGRWVKVVAGTGSQGHGHVLVALLADGDTKPLGKLLAVSGQGANFKASILIRMEDEHALGGAATLGALASTDIGKGLEGSGDGKLEVETTADAGFGQIVGGTKGDLRVYFDEPYFKTS